MIVDLGVFFGVTIVFMGGCAFMAGNALGRTWRPWWQMLPYGLMLGLADRFIGFALFGGELTSIAGYALDSASLIAIGLFAHRVTVTQRMTDQYPWLYERVGLLGWRERTKHHSPSSAV